MKRAPLKYLVYREFYMVKRNSLIATIVFLGVALICILVQLSMEMGNLSKLSPENMEMLKEVIHVYICYLPIGVSGMIFGAVCEGALKEVSQIWQRFRLSTPVSKWRFALAKHIIIIIMFGLSLILSFGYMVTIFAIKNEKITINDISITIIILLAALLLEILTQIFIILFRSMEKALLAIMGISFVAIWVIFFKVGAKMVLTMEENTITLTEVIGEWCMSILPYTPVILIIIMMVGFVATALLYKRRER